MFLVRRYFVPPTKQHGERSKIAPLLFGKHFKNTCKGLKGKHKRNGTALGTNESQMLGRKSPIGKRRPFGQRNSTRRYSPIHLCSSRQKKTRTHTDAG